jgi:hypothetical protein
LIAPVGPAAAGREKAKRAKQMAREMKDFLVNEASLVSFSP